jgi:hypothetical protein
MLRWACGCVRSAAQRVQQADGSHQPLHRSATTLLCSALLALTLRRLTLPHSLTPSSHSRARARALTRICPQLLPSRHIDRR